MERLSSIKKSPLLAAAQNMWLAVYPVEIQYARDVADNTVIYFEKNYQVIGDLHTVLPPSSKNRKHTFNSLDHLIKFRMFSLQVLTYKWSLYRKAKSGQEEFIESCTVDFRPLFGNQQLMQTQRSSLYNSADSLSLFGSIQKEMKVKFINTGMTLTFIFFATDDIKSIEESISLRISTFNPADIVEDKQESAQDKKPAEPTPGGQNGTSIEGSIDVSSKMEGTEHPSNPSKGNESNHEPLNPVPEETPTEQKKEEQTPIQPPQHNEFPAGQQTIEGGDIYIPVDQTPIEKPACQTNESYFHKEPAKDEGLLKMESQKESKIKEDSDKKIEEEKLEAIVQQPEKTATIESKSHQIQPAPGNQHSSFAGLLPSSFKSSVSQTVDSVMNSKVDMKKVLIAFLVVIILMLVVLWPREKAPQNKENKENKRKKEKNPKLKKK